MNTLLLRYSVWFFLPFLHTCKNISRILAFGHFSNVWHFFVWISKKKWYTGKVRSGLQIQDSDGENDGNNDTTIDEGSKQNWIECRGHESSLKCLNLQVQVWMSSTIEYNILALVGKTCSIMWFFSLPLSLSFPLY